MRSWHALLVAIVAFASCTRPEREIGTRPSADPSPPIAAAAPASSSSAPTPEALAERAFHPDGSALFAKKLPPKPGDWLARFPERGQSFVRYRGAEPLRPTAARNKLVMQPLGTFGPDDEALVEKLRGFMSDFFMLPVETRKPIPLPKKGRRIRNEDGRTWTQHYTRVLLDETLPPLVPEDAIVYVGVLVEDLYPDPKWNFVFGQATLEERVGVYSLARFFPDGAAEKAQPEAQRNGLRRSAALLAHETGHAFGIEHCTEYECVMNGSNSLEELDRQFEELCPIDLQKLSWNIGFAPKARYERLRAFYRREGMDDLATWLDRRIRQLDTGVTPG